MILILVLAITLGCPSSWATSCEQDLTELDILELMRSKHSVGGLMIEIGGGDRPLCSHCLQVDRFLSSSDLNEGKFDPTDVNNWAAARGGVVADAAQLPFPRESTALVLTRNFPWFNMRTNGKS